MGRRRLGEIRDRQSVGNEGSRASDFLDVRQSGG